MKSNFIKVLPILLLVLVGAKGSADLTRESRGVSYSSCVEALKNGADSGIYTLHLPSSGLQPFDVYCLKDPENGPAWTVVQRRQDGSEDFYRNWEDYKNGFGDLNGEFFLGLEYWHALTNQEEIHELWIQLADWEGATKYEKYSQFQIGNESSKYAMEEINGYSGDAIDSLRYHIGRKFSTKDQDNDMSSKHCAVEHKGAWWFNNCLDSHLNGEYLRGVAPETAENKNMGVIWYRFRGSYYSHRYAHMALRPRN